MNKIKLSAFISVVIVGRALAEAPSPAFDGIYLGGGFTYVNGKISDKLSTLKSASRGVGFNGFTGYGTVLGGGFYLGAELGVGFDGSRFKNKGTTNSPYSWKSNSSLTYSIAGRLGYAFSNILPYFKFGFEGRSPVKLRNSSGNQVQIGGKIVQIDRNGFVLGAGVDYALTKNVFVRGEYMHNFGSRSSFSTNNTKVADLRATSDMVLIGAAYRY